MIKCPLKIEQARMNAGLGIYFAVIFYAEVYVCGVYKSNQMCCDDVGVLVLLRIGLARVAGVTSTFLVQARNFWAYPSLFTWRERPIASA